ncbi:hypothetical protein N9164_07050 [Draconibacterium sp.]|nr:hypothetical protein [Draconibacterium sp.]
MNKIILLFFLISFIGKAFSQPISLHPENQHYLLYKGKPTVLVTSAEHYGAVLNADFDYEKYLHTMHDEGMNYTRIFTGSYVEIPGSFNIENNTLAPAVGSFLVPWKRIDEVGLYEGEKKFNLNEWNTIYFERLDKFISLANELDIIVEVTFFCSTYQDAYWERNPFNPGNNINEIPINLERKKSNTLNNGILSGFQIELVKKIVTELNVYDNVFYEIQNEPWSDDPQKVMRTLRTLDPKPGQGDWYKWSEMASDASLKWQKVMAKAVVDTEKELPKKHLIAQNYTNFKHSVDKIDPNISVMNFHYVWPEAVWMNYGWNRPINFDESGFAGTETNNYLRQAWQFMMAGGAIFNNLDYSFYIGKEDGTGENNAPGGGSKEFRRQLQFLRNFIESMDFVKMKPDFYAVYHAPGVQVQCISEPGKQYALVLTGVASKWTKLNLPKGKYNYEFVSPYSGKTLKKGFFKHKKNGIKELNVPQFDRMVALKIMR